MEFSPDQLERLFRNLETVANLAENVKLIVKRQDDQDHKLETQQEQHEENVARLDAISDAMLGNEQKNRADRQNMMSNLENLQRTTDAIRDEVGGRLARLETPLRRVLARRRARRAVWVKVASIGSSVAVVIWVALEPARRVIIEWFMADWFPPHK